MDKGLSSPNFNAAHARCNSSSRVFEYFFSATSFHHYQMAVHMFSQRPPLARVLRPTMLLDLQPLSTPSQFPPTKCCTPQFYSDTQARLARINGALGFRDLDRDPRRQEAARDADQPANIRRLCRRRPFSRIDFDADLSSDARCSNRQRRCERA